MLKVASLSLSLLLLSSTAIAKPPHVQGNPHKHGKQKFERESPTSFAYGERQTIRNYYQHLPPGLAKKYNRTGTLPPGWAAKTHVGNVLPREYDRYIQPVPRELHDSIESPLGTEILRIERATRTILDELNIDR